MSYYLAIDIGASSGRHLLGEIKDEKLTITEIYRFENSIKENNGTLVWDTEELVENVIRGLEECRKAEKIPQTVAIDTWGVAVFFNNAIMVLKGQDTFVVLLP